MVLCCGFVSIVLVGICLGAAYYFIIIPGDDTTGLRHPTESQVKVPEPEPPNYPSFCSEDGHDILHIVNKTHARFKSPKSSSPDKGISTDVVLQNKTQLNSVEIPEITLWETHQLYLGGDRRETALRAPRMRGCNITIKRSEYPIRLIGVNAGYQLTTTLFSNLQMIITTKNSNCEIIVSEKHTTRCKCPLSGRFPFQMIRLGEVCTSLFTHNLRMFITLRGKVNTVFAEWESEFPNSFPTLV